MFDRLKRTLVDSFVGAIALGYLFAQAMLNLVNVVTFPVASWVRRTEFPPTKDAVSFLAILPPLVSFVVLLPIWYVLLRWLYYTPPPKNEESNRASA
jgi:ABC-type spermidine/putrescine transport system permease subunit I